jgi:hypothetical protein
MRISWLSSHFLEGVGAPNEQLREPETVVTLVDHLICIPCSLSQYLYSTHPTPGNIELGQKQSIYWMPRAHCGHGETTRFPGCHHGREWMSPHWQQGHAKPFPAGIRRLPKFGGLSTRNFR